MIFLFQSPKVIYWYGANTCKGEVPVDQLLLIIHSVECMIKPGENYFFYESPRMVFSPNLHFLIEEEKMSSWEN